MPFCDSRSTNQVLKMKFFITIAVITWCAVKADKYTSQYDNIDVDEILHSDRLLKNYMNCFLERGKCTPAGLEIKVDLPESLENDCEKCNEKQKKIGEKVLRYLIEERRDMFDELEEKYDPDGSYRARYELRLKEKGINI